MKKPGIHLDLQYPAAPESPYVRVGVDYPPTAPAAAPSSPDDASSSLAGIADVVDSDSFRYAAGVALVFHGYRRTGSILWALLYGLAGKEIPVVAVPVALAQGFGHKKSCP